jgi:hypothetical protein
MTRFLNLLGAVIGFVKSATVRVRLRISVVGPKSPKPDRAAPRLKVQLAAIARFGLWAAIQLVKAVAILLLLSPIPACGILAWDWWLGDGFVSPLALGLSILVFLVVTLAGLALQPRRCHSQPRRCRRFSRFAIELQGLSPSGKAAVAARCQRDLGFLVPAVEEAISSDAKALSKLNTYLLDEIASNAERISFMRAKQVMEPRIYDPLS